MKLRVTVNGSAYEVDVEVLEDREGVMHGGGQHMQSFVPPSAVASAPPARPAKLTASARPAVPAPVAAQAAPAADGSGGPTLTSPIPGTIVEILAKAGQQVALGEAVAIIDAMKMHTQITANQDGVIKSILVKPGETVQMGQPLLTFEG